jgi:hypothetical protein
MNLSKSLEELEGKKIDRPDFDSNLARECVRLWSTPISELSTENLRILIGQNLGLTYLVPVALNILSKNLFAEGDMYKGDLLANVAKISDEFWSRHQDLNNQLVDIKIDIEEIYETISDEIMPCLNSKTYK